MRFLFGLLLGAAVVLITAEGLAGGGNWQMRLSVLEDYLRHRIDDTAVPARRSAAVDGQPAPATPAVTADEPARQPIQRPPDPPGVDEPASEEMDEPASEEIEASAPAEPKSQGVWAPFHSEMSASGFAERLTDTLNHPFHVERRGPGRYQVVFAYDDEPQREALLARAAEATGLPL